MECLRNDNSSKLYEIHCQNKQQLVSTGRMSALQYTYFGCESLVNTNSHIEFSVCDIDGKNVEYGETTEIPRKR